MGKDESKQTLKETSKEICKCACTDCDDLVEDAGYCEFCRRVCRPDGKKVPAITVKELHKLRSACADMWDELQERNPTAARSSFDDQLEEYCASVARRVVGAFGARVERRLGGGR
jgi:hypothetical protein